MIAINEGNESSVWPEHTGYDPIMMYGDRPDQPGPNLATRAVPWIRR
jgi:hypothetical protein